MTSNRSWKGSKEWPSRFALAALPSALLLSVSAACGPAPPPPLPAELDFPAAYRVEADGTIELDDITVPGRVRMDYLLYPDGTAVVTRFDGWARGFDIVVNFLWWETDRERLRCNRLSIVEPIVGTHSGSTITIPTGNAEVVGESYEQDPIGGVCPGPVRRLSAANNTPLTASHDPVADRFAINSSFRASYDGNDFNVRLDLAGRFLNRPPIAELGVGGPGVSWDRIQGGCPPLDQENPPAVQANRPQGLVVNLLSLSHDPDGGGSIGPSEYPRADLSFEQWAKSTDGGKFEHLGEGRFIGPVLFEHSLDHVLMLSVTDRAGAMARKICRFHVAPAPRG